MDETGGPRRLFGNKRSKVCYCYSFYEYVFSYLFIYLFFMYYYIAEVAIL